MAVSEALVEKPGSSLYPWQETVWQKLMNYSEAGRIPHALMASGLDGIGKLNLAVCFANYLLCSDHKTPEFRCGRCSACRLIDAGTHPDLIRVEPLEPGKAITIDRIRDLTESLSLSTRTHRYRIVILRPADRLNSAAGNALLKTLEEPGKGILMILLTSRSWNLPATIKSRCQRLDIPVPDHGSAMAWLKRKFSSSQAEILLSMAAGAPLKALELGLAGNLARRHAVLNWWREIASHHSDPVGIAEKLSSFPARDVLAWITGWTTDMIRLAMAPSVESLVNPDLRPALQAEVQKLNLKQLFRFYERLIQSAALIDSPVNIQLLLESILIDWYAMTRTL
ncbi:MAG: DNA polymerase III subunit delta' [Methylococcales bacterium]